MIQRAGQFDVVRRNICHLNVVPDTVEEEDQCPRGPDESSAWEEDNASPPRPSPPCPSPPCQIMTRTQTGTAIRTPDRL